MELLREKIGRMLEGYFNWSPEAYRDKTEKSLQIADAILAIPEIRDALEAKYGGDVTLIVPDGLSVTLPSDLWVVIRPADDAMIDVYTT